MMCLFSDVFIRRAVAWAAFERDHWLQPRLKYTLTSQHLAKRFGLDIPAKKLKQYSKQCNEIIQEHFDSTGRPALPLQSDINKLRVKQSLV